jgi:hypothetical protein
VKIAMAKRKESTAPIAEGSQRNTQAPLFGLANENSVD